MNPIIMEQTLEGHAEYILSTMPDISDADKAEIMAEVQGKTWADVLGAQSNDGISDPNCGAFDVDLCKKQLSQMIAAEDIAMDPASFCKGQLDQMRTAAILKSKGRSDQF